MGDKACTIRTRKFLVNKLLGRKQFVSPLFPARVRSRRACLWTPVLVRMLVLFAGPGVCGFEPGEKRRQGRQRTHRINGAGWSGGLRQGRTTPRRVAAAGGAAVLGTQWKERRARRSGADVCACALCQQHWRLGFGVWR